MPSRGLAGLSPGHQEGISERRSGRVRYAQLCTPRPSAATELFDDAVVGNDLAHECVGTKRTFAHQFTGEELQVKFSVASI